MAKKAKPAVKTVSVPFSVSLREVIRLRTQEFNKTLLEAIGAEAREKGYPDKTEVRFTDGGHFLLPETKP